MNFEVGNEFYCRLSKIKKDRRRFFVFLAVGLFVVWGGWLGWV